MIERTRSLPNAHLDVGDVDLSGEAPLALLESDEPFFCPGVSAGVLLINCRQEKTPVSFSLFAGWSAARRLPAPVVGRLPRLPPNPPASPQDCRGGSFGAIGRVAGWAGANSHGTPQPYCGHRPESK